MDSFFRDIRSYVGFGESDSLALQKFLPLAEAHLERIADDFYRRIEQHPDALAVLEGPDQIERLKGTLVDWMRSGLAGPHDEEFHEVRKRIGRVHVRIDLPQKYMFTAMNVVRLAFRELIEEAYAEDPASRRRVSDALDKLLDLELAIMLDSYREDSDARLRRKERLATIGQLAAGVAHDLRNPLSVMESSLYLIDQQISDNPKAQRHIERIGEQLELSGSIINNLLEMARSRKARPTPIKAAELFDRALTCTALPPGIEVVREVADALTLYVEPGIMAQAISNLIGNAAVAYKEEAGTVTLRARPLEGGGASLEVIDRGPGFDPEILPNVFEPLVTGRTRGIGIGLALVKNIIERHGGDVAAENHPEGGARVRIVLPAPEEQT